MKKEIVITIIVGLVISFLVTVGVYQVRQAMTMPKRSTLPSPAPSTSGVLTPEDKLASLTLVTPANGSIQKSPEAIVTGTATPESPLILLVGEKEYLSTSDKVGHFSFEVQLATGPNVLTLYAINSEGESSTLRRTVFVGDYFTTASPSAVKK